MYTKLLVANRGEIAVRILRACREMGIATVAVYSEADANAQHVWMADEACLLGPSPASESYLCIDKIVAAAVEYDCQAVHPGYGFLAENADFAQAVLDAGRDFVGPTPETIRTMGSKTAARNAMEAAVVPVVPGYQAGGSDEELIGAAEQIGFPLLVKAAHGGGGKGMRVVRAMDQLGPALQAAHSEAKQAFGNDRLFLERLVEQARHIEFQIFGDSFGNIVHLFERECSIQRRHQKIVEESPSPFVDDDLRNRMGEAAVAAARAVDYCNAGTVEFLVDTQKNFYFLEMNTRLQVEHPITELVTGVDLVKVQIEVAAGAPLPFEQADLSQRGHAIECRIYAEDAQSGFMPSVGKLQTVREPSGPGIRVDSGVVSGDEVSLHYDPMLAKLAVLGADRAGAIQKMARALRDFVVLGEGVTNISFLRDVVTHSAFLQGETSTDFVDTHFPRWKPREQTQPDQALIAAVLFTHLQQANSATGKQPPSPSDSRSDPHSPWRGRDGFRAG